MNKVVITGVCGFIFSHFLRQVHKNRPDWQIVGIDCCDESINLSNITPNNERYRFYLADIRDSRIIENIFAIEKPDLVIHGAARSFVCSSIEDPLPFIETNVVGTQILVNASVKHQVKRFLYVSSDEVYGSLGINEASWTEDSLTLPSSPYSASKLSGEHIVRAAHKTYGLEYQITRSCNVFGERQNTRNLIPKVITSLLSGKTIPLHNEGRPIREWIYVQDKINAILTVLDKGKINETYNIGTGIEHKNIEIVNILSLMLFAPPILDMRENRLGQDFRYSVNASKLRGLGWQPMMAEKEAMQRTIDWYKRQQ